MEYERLTFRHKSVVDGTEQIGYTEKLAGCYRKQEMILQRLAELEDKIEQGTLIELPCPIRTMIYYIVRGKKKIGFWGKWKYCYTIMEIPFELEMLDAYGNNWFLTREEAEKRLLELQGETKL